MSNILIIKHGSLGDLIQANGAMKDIKESFPNDKVLLLTTPPYVNFMSNCPYINGVLIDKRLPRWNIFYLLRLRKMLLRFEFEKVFDLQNSSRTNFYRKFFFKGVDWSSSETSLEKNQKKLIISTLLKLNYRIFFKTLIILMRKKEQVFLKKIN